MRRSREHLAGTFWDRSAEEQARASLRQTLSSVRRTLSSGHALINSDSESVWLDTHTVEVDALQFERLAAARAEDSLEKAVTLYRGELLSGFSLREEGFEQWVSAERRRLGGSCRLCDDRFRYRHSRVEVLVERHCVLDGADPLLCHSIGYCPCLGTASGRTEPWRWEIGYAPRLCIFYRDIWMYQAITAKLLR